jgi:hypothetical protein
MGKKTRKAFLGHRQDTYGTSVLHRSVTVYRILQGAQKLSGIAKNSVFSD